MKSPRHAFKIAAALAVTAACAHVLAQRDAARAPDASHGPDIGDFAIQPVPAASVQIHDAFWAPRLEALRAVTIPAALQRLADTGRIDNFVRAAAVLRGETPANRRPPATAFDDADVYKVIEAASATLSTHPDAKLDAQLDDLIAKIAAAQEKDGYLYTARTMNPQPPLAAAGADRWINEKADSYELSDLGYLYEAAVAHFRATGKRTLLDVAVKSADLLDKTFGPDKKAIWPGHEMVEMGLMDLWRATGEPRYRALAKFFVDQRGPDANAPAGRGRGARPNQSAQKAVDQIAATGTALEAMHLFTAMTDLAGTTGGAVYGDAVDKLWVNVVGQKLYITGGVGGNDGTFGRNFLLANSTAGSNTAAAADSEIWNERLFQLHADGKYMDVLERTLYNSLLAGMTLDGSRFFDANSLESVGRQQRRQWLAPAQGNAQGAAAAAAAVSTSSPMSLARFLAALPGYIYATKGDALYVNLYAAGTATIKLPTGRTIKIDQETTYPWDGAVKLTLTPDQPAKFALNVRIPGWARNEPAPGGLYAFADKNDAPVQLTVNGQPVAAQPVNGYVAIERQWAPGDVVSLTLPMPVRRVAAGAQVVDDAGRIVLQRGPIVYCLEGAGNAKAKVRNLMIADDAALQTAFEPNLLGGVLTITGKALAMSMDEQDKLVGAEQPFIATPYYTWANRGQGEMVVWIPNTQAGPVPIAAPNLSATARITTSPRQNGTNAGGAAAKDGIEPKSSHDNNPLSHFDWWPDRSTADKPVVEWCVYTWDQPQTISQTQVYWWDDSKNGGGCAPPVSWKAFYKDGDNWVPVETTDKYGVEDDKYNKVTFKPVKTTGLRLEMVVPTDYSIGIQEWKVR